MMTKHLIAALMLTASVLVPSDGIVDEHVFSKKEWTQRQPDLILIEYKSQAELEAAYVTAKGRPVPTGGQLNAFSEFNLGGSECNIHYVDPAISYKPASIGHELMHCAYGRWH